MPSRPNVPVKQQRQQKKCWLIRFSLVITTVKLLSSQIFSLSCYKNLTFLYPKWFLTTFFCCSTSTLNLRPCLTLQWEKFQLRSPISPLLNLSLLHQYSYFCALSWTKKANTSTCNLIQFTFHTEELCSYRFPLSPAHFIYSL